MAQQQATAVDLAGRADGAARSISDLPFYRRWSYHCARFIRSKPLGAFGVFLIFAVLFVAVFQNYIDRYDPEQIFTGVNPLYDPELAEKAQTDPTVRLDNPPEAFEQAGPLLLAKPSADHWLGTDHIGRDLYSRIVHGARTAVIVGFGASIIAVFFGIVVGLISAYFSGGVDFGIQRLVDAFQAFPPLVLLLLFNQVVADPTINWITISLGIVGIASVVRIVRSSVLATREEVYITAAKTVGATDMRVMLKHILPNILAPIIVIFTSTVGVYILAEATLAFLGLGDPTRASWGKMIEEGRRQGAAAPLMALFVGSALTFTVLGFNLAGDALRDVLDPRLRGRGGRAGF